MANPTATATPGIERRRHFRATVADDSQLRVRIWRLAPGVTLATRPMPSQLLPVDVRQVSAEGMTIALCGKDGQPPRVTPTDRLRVEVQYADRTALVEARLREPADRPATDAPFAAGLRLHGRPTDHAHREAMATIATIVAQVQRESLRARRAAA
jgi:hypothetical protein